MAVPALFLSTWCPTNPNMVYLLHFSTACIYVSPQVGIGGEYDTTNVIRRPKICGITSLGIDHTKLLGDTIEDIAWHKVRRAECWKFT